MTTRKRDISRVVGEAVSAYRLTRPETSSDEIAYCDAGEMPEGAIGLAADATDVTNGALLSVLMLALACETIELCASGEISQGAEVYTADDGKITATNTGFRVGRLVDVTGNSATADGDVVEVIPDPAWVAMVQTAASGTVTNTTDETAFDESHTIPANSLKAGDSLRIRALVTATGTNSTDTLTVKIKLGTVEIVSTGAVDVVDNDVAVIDMLVTIRTIGASGTLVASGFQILDAIGTAAVSAAKQSTAIDTTADNAVTVTAEWSAANAGDICRLDQLVVEKLG